MFKELFRQNALFIVSNNVKISETSNIPIVSIKKLDKVDDEEEFIELIQDS